MDQLKPEYLTARYHNLLRGSQWDSVPFKFFMDMLLVVSTHLKKYARQNGSFPHFFRGANDLKNI